MSVPYRFSGQLKGSNVRARIKTRTETFGKEKNLPPCIYTNVIPPIHYLKIFIAHLIRETHEHTTNILYVCYIEEINDLFLRFMKAAYTKEQVA